MDDVVPVIVKRALRYCAATRDKGVESAEEVAKEMVRWTGGMPMQIAETVFEMVKHPINALHLGWIRFSQILPSWICFSKGFVPRNGTDQKPASARVYGTSFAFVLQVHRLPCFSVLEVLD